MKDDYFSGIIENYGVILNSNGKLVDVACEGVSLLMGVSDDLKTAICYSDEYGNPSDTKPIKIWNVEKGNVRREIKGYILDFNLSKNLIFTKSSKIFKLQDASFIPINRMVYDDAKILPNSEMIFLFSGDSETTVWDIGPTSIFTLDEAFPLKRVMRNDYVLILGNNSALKVWSYSDSKLLFDSLEHQDIIATLTIQNKTIFSGSWDKIAKIWELETGKLIHSLEGHQSAVTTVAFPPNDQQALTASHDATAKLWNATTGKLIHTFKGHTASITQASFTPDGSKILTASNDTTLKIWDTATGQLIQTLSSHTGPILTASCSKILSASEDHTAKIWDTDTGELLATLDTHKGFVNDAQWSQQGNYIVTTSQDKRGILWDAKTFKLHKTLKGHLGAVKKGKFTPGEKQVVTIYY